MPRIHQHKVEGVGGGGGIALVLRARLVSQPFTRSIRAAPTHADCPHPQLNICYCKGQIVIWSTKTPTHWTQLVSANRLTIRSVNSWRWNTYDSWTGNTLSQVILEDRGSRETLSVSWGWPTAGAEDICAERMDLPSQPHSISTMQLEWQHTCSLRGTQPLPIL